MPYGRPAPPQTPFISNTDGNPGDEKERRRTTDRERLSMTRQPYRYICNQMYVILKNGWRQYNVLVRDKNECSEIFTFLTKEGE